MKSKLTILIMAIAITILLCFVFVACDNDSKENEKTPSDIIIEEPPITTQISDANDASKLAQKGYELEYHDGIATVVGYTGTESTITIPDKVLYDSKEYIITEIGPNAFKDVNVFKIVLPNTIIVIGKGAFSGSSVGTINLPESIRVIEDEAFKGCKSLSKLDFKANIQSIEKSVFEGCSALSNISIPDSVIYIRERAFAYCYIKSIKLPSSLKIIEDRAFYCALKCEVEFPSYLETIGEYAFQQCDFQDNLVLPESITIIGRSAFEYAEIKSVVWPKYTERIEERVFEGSTLESITLQEGLKQIGEYAFSMTNIVSIVIPSTMKEIEDNAFMVKSLVEVVNLSSLDIHVGVANYANGGVAFYALDVYNSLDYESKLSYTEDGFVLYTKGANKYVVAFRDGLKLPLAIKDMRKIVIPNDVTIINQYAFFGTLVLEVTIPTSVVTIKESSFRNLNITDIHYEGTQEQWQEINKDSFWRGGNVIIHCSDGDYEEIYSGIY